MFIVLKSCAGAKQSEHCNNKNNYKALFHRYRGYWKIYKKRILKNGILPAPQYNR